MTTNCPSTVRTVAAAAVAGVALTLAAPIAHADDVAIRSAVDGVRAGSSCLALNYRDDLAGAAYAYARGGVVPKNGYPGEVVGFKGWGDPASAATDMAVTSLSGHADILNCKYTDFGVSLFKDSRAVHSVVAIVLGAPAPEPSRPKVDLPRAEITCGAACEALAQAPGGPTATVTSDVDVYDEPGGGGNVIGILRMGEVVNVVKACPSDDWCALADGRFAFGSFFKNN